MKIRAGIACLIVAALAPATPVAAARSETHTVTVEGGPAFVLWRFEPPEITVARGDRVRWKNPTPTDHHVAPYEGDWSEVLHLDSGGTATWRFRKTGTYRYRCDIQTHSEMVGGICVGQCGTIVVE